MKAAIILLLLCIVIHLSKQEIKIPYEIGSKHLLNSDTITVSQRYKEQVFYINHKRVFVTDECFFELNAQEIIN